MNTALITEWWPETFCETTPVFSFAPIPGCLLPWFYWFEDYETALALES